MYNGYPTDDISYMYAGYGGDFRNNQTIKIDIVLTIYPLLQQLQRVDRIRLTLEESGGSRKEMEELTAALTEEATLVNSYGSGESCLKDPANIQQTLRRLGCVNVHFEVRRLHNGMPAYFLCRIKNDHWGTTPLIIENYYCSPGFPISDKRFMRLLRNGKERFYLNLGPYFQSLNLEFSERENLLFRIGQQVLLAGWHEDQYPGLMASQLLRLYSFPQGVELLYLILSSDLPNLRHNVDDAMIEFFHTLCPQPAIATFLKKLQDMDGNSLVGLPRQARAHYKSLATGFGELLQVKVNWGSRNTPVELYKILFGNFSRPEALGDTLQKDNMLWEAAKQLEQTAEGIIAELNGK